MGILAIFLSLNMRTMATGANAKELFNNAGCWDFQGAK